MPTNKHMKKKRLIFGIIALQFILFPTFAQDKLLGILKTELHQQMQEKTFMESLSMLWLTVNL